jgi:hypothetical protein
MWVKVCVGMSKANDLANRNPGATEGSGAYTVLLCEVKICYEAPTTDGGRFSLLPFYSSPDNFINHFS